MSVADRFAGARFVTFDCYGTLVDWLGGVGAFARALLERRERADVDPRAFVAAWERLQRKLLDPPYRPYAEILETSLAAALARFGLDADSGEARAFSRSMGDWPPFPEVPDALRRAAALRPLVLVSNTDRAILERTRVLLAAPFHAAITAEDSRRYKPDPEAFAFALRRLGARPDEVLHVSAYDEYDLVPAARLGFRTVAVRRPGDPAPPVAPADAAVADLGELAAILERPRTH